MGQREQPASSPRILLELTNACNLNCTFCHSDSGRPRDHELQQEEVFGILGDIRKFVGAGTNVTLSGGEPLLVPWALQVLDLALTLELRPTLLTNGTLLPQYAEQLAHRVRRGARLRVSLPGLERSACDAASGGERFELALSGIRAMAEAGGAPDVDVLLFPDSVEPAVSYAPALANQLSDQVQVSLNACHIGGRATEVHCFGNRVDQERAVRQVLEAVGAATPVRSAGAPRLRDGCDCSLGLHLAIRSDAKVFSCHRMQEAPIGSLRLQNLDYFTRTRFERARPVSSLAQCTDCSIARLCGAGCRAENLLYTGNPECPPCGPWRKSLLSALIAEGRSDAPEWDLLHLIAEARRRGLPVPVLDIARHRTQPNVRSLPIAVAASALAAACFGDPPHRVSLDAGVAPENSSQAAASSTPLPAPPSGFAATAPEPSSRSQSKSTAPPPLVTPSRRRTQNHKWHEGDTYTLGF